MIAKPGLFCGGELRRLSYRRQLETRHGAPQVGAHGQQSNFVRWRDEKILLVHRNSTHVSLVHRERERRRLYEIGINTLGFAFTPFPPDYQALT